MTALTRNDLAAAESAKQGYRYQRFTLALMLQDFRFNASSLRPGDMAPDVDLTNLDSSRVRLSEIVGARPVVLVTGSLSCPMTASSVPSLNRLLQDFGDAFDVVLLYVREAHPGELLRQPQSLAEKLEHATSFKDELAVRARVVVDDIDGTLHRLLDAKPNAAFIFDATGRLVFRSLWASDEGGLRTALTSLRDATQLRASQSTRMVQPMLRALGSVSETLTRAGASAHRDLLLAAAPMEIGGLMAGRLKPLPRDLRGPALMVVGLVATAAAAVAFFTFR